MEGTGVYNNGVREWNTITLESEDEVNVFLEKNPEYGVIWVSHPKLIHVAKNSDGGRKIE